MKRKNDIDKSMSANKRQQSHSTGGNVNPSSNTNQQYYPQSQYGYGTTYNRPPAIDNSRQSLLTQQVMFNQYATHYYNVIDPLSQYNNMYNNPNHSPAPLPMSVPPPLPKVPAYTPPLPPLPPDEPKSNNYSVPPPKLSPNSSSSAVPSPWSQREYNTPPPHYTLGKHSSAVWSKKKHLGNSTALGKSSPIPMEPVSNKVVVNKKAKRKSMSTRYCQAKEFNLEDAQKAIDLEREYKRKHDRENLLLKFPDPDLDQRIVKSFSSAIENVHFQQPAQPRFCYVTLRRGTNVEEVVKSIEEIPFGCGKVSVKRHNYDEKLDILPEEIDPYTLYIGNLPTRVTVNSVRENFPTAQRIDIGYAQRMKYTRYAFVRYQNVEESMEAFKSAYHLVLQTRSLVVRFRRMKGNVVMPCEIKGPSRLCVPPKETTEELERAPSASSSLNDGNHDDNFMITDVFERAPSTTSSLNEGRDYESSAVTVGDLMGEPSTTPSLEEGDHENNGDNVVITDVAQNVPSTKAAPKIASDCKSSENKQKQSLPIQPSAEDMTATKSSDVLPDQNHEVVVIDNEKRLNSNNTEVAVVDSKVNVLKEAEQLMNSSSIVVGDAAADGTVVKTEPGTNGRNAESDGSLWGINVKEEQIDEEDDEDDLPEDALSDEDDDEESLVDRKLSI